MNNLSTSKRFIVLILSILTIFWLIPKVFAVSPVQLPYNDGGGSGSVSCSVVSALFDISPADNNLLDSPDLDSEAKNPLGLWYSKVSPPPVSIDIKTSGCAGKTIQVTLSGQNPGNVYGYNYSNVDALRQKSFVVPPGEEFKINMTPGQEGCNTTYILHGTQPPCRFFIIVQTPDQINSGSGGYTSIQSRVDNGNTHGLLTYDCDGKDPYYCAARSPSGTRLPNIILSPWVYRSDTSANPDNNINLQTSGSGAINPNNTIYSGLSDALSAIGVKVNTITSAGDLGTFLNAIIAFITAIMGVIAVIMIMYEGFVYMRSDNVDFKTRTRGNIVKVVLGFLLLLSTYVILKTINPDLLNLVPNISQVLMTIQQNSPANPKDKSSDEQPAVIVTPTNTGFATDPKTNISSYDSFFTASAGSKGVDCTLMKADMYIESGGNPNVTSSVGARGLMQIMPAVAQQFQVGFDQMFDPKTNIETSSKLWQYNYRGACNGAASNSVCNVNDAKYIIAANSAGAGANAASTLCPGQTAWQCTKNTGYQETRDYIPKVMNAYSILKQNNWGCN